MRSFISGGVACLLLSLSGCDYQQPPVPDDNLVAKQNPHPTQGYRVTMTIHDAPGPFALAKAEAFYKPKLDTGCHSEKRPLYASVQAIPLSLKRVSATQYSTVIYLDQLQAGDYYGQGLCYWESDAAELTVLPTGSSKETSFTIRFQLDDLPKGEPLIAYFFKKDYPYPTEHDSSFPGYARTLKDWAGLHLSDSTMFSISISPEKQGL